MRTMLLAHIPSEAGNRAIKDGSIAQVVEKTLATLRPESAYFFPHDGMRAFAAVFDLDDPSTIAASVEPLWLALDADVELIPVMVAEDLKKGLARL